jgi:hypothetical protein
MTAYYIAVVVGIATAVVYVTLAGRALLRVRRSVLGGDERPPDTTDVYEGQAAGFAWKAAGGVIASTLVIVLISLGSAWWYLVPFLAIGSSIAVIVAFLVDPQEQG